MENYLLKVEKLTKTYGEKKVVDGISFGIKEGEVLGFLGSNGAGKSTTIRMITGIESYEEGKVIYKETPINSNYKNYQKEIGVVPQEIALYNDLSAYDNVKFFCSLYGYKKKELEKRVEEALIFAGLWERRKERPSQYSGGMKRRLNIACSIAHSPKLLIMDEPTVGIDPQSRNHIMETIRKLNKRGTTVIYISHYMEEIEILCNRIILIEKGVIIEDCKKDKLKEKYEKYRLKNLEEIFLHITGTNLRDGEV